MKGRDLTQCRILPFTSSQFLATILALLLSKLASGPGGSRLAVFALPKQIALRVSFRPLGPRATFGTSSTLLSGKAASEVSAKTTEMSFMEFLRSQKVNPAKHFVVGNAAGDADSIVSALTLAYVESTFGSTRKTPIVSISKRELESQRPEVSFLFNTVGLDNIADYLLFIDDSILSAPVRDNNSERKVTLVDHNRVDQDQFRKCEVVEILDHHFDEEQHTETCFGDSRRIAFQEDKALVASTCTLVAERLKEVMKPPYHSTVATLLLGTILLDSVNMIPAAGKATARDKNAIQDLLNNTDWSTITSQKAISQWWPFSINQQRPLDQNMKPDTNLIFESLQSAKFDPIFWAKLSVQDALRLDYKEFAVQKDPASNVEAIGMSSVLMPMESFLSKPDIWRCVYQYMKKDASVNFLTVMFFYTDKETGQNHRQLMLCGTKPEAEELVKAMSKYICKNADAVSLELSEIDAGDLAFSCVGNEHLEVRLHKQGNTKASRKQVAPLLIKFFEQK